jgi:hypothetical protein
MPSYALYAYFEAILRARVAAAIQTLVTFPVPTEEPHVTVVFGPVLVSDASEALTRDGMADVYPGVCALADSVVDRTLAYRGVSTFAPR